MVFPIVLRSGKRLFGEGAEAKGLELTGCTQLESGSLYLTYRARRGVAPQAAAPAVVGPDRVAHLLPALAMAVEVPVLELHARAVGRLGDEAHLDLAGRRGGLDLPPRLMSQLKTTRSGGS